MHTCDYIKGKRKVICLCCVRTKTETKKGVIFISNRLHRLFHTSILPRAWSTERDSVRLLPTFSFHAIKTIFTKHQTLADRERERERETIQKIKTGNSPTIESVGINSINANYFLLFIISNNQSAKFRKLPIAFFQWKILENITCAKKYDRPKVSHAHHCIIFSKNGKKNHQ